MMKSKLFTLLLVAMAGNAYSQSWGNISGNNPTYTTGNVGIGMSSTPGLFDGKLSIYTSSIFGALMPELKISRAGLFSGGSNYFEIYRQSITGITAMHIIDNRGFVGILKKNPLQALHVAGNALIEESVAANKNICIGTNSTYPNDAKLTIYSTYVLGPSVPELKISRASVVPGSGSNYLEIYRQTLFTGVTMLDVINPSGYLGILTSSPVAPLDVNGNAKIRKDFYVAGITVLGTTATPISTPPGYSLYVGNGILTEKLRVANHDDLANWADFVFNKDYELMPIYDVEQFVKKYRHLPEIPSASDVAKDGIDVGSIEAKLLQKVEELTLYVIQQQKEIDDLKKQVNTK